MLARTDFPDCKPAPAASSAAAAQSHVLTGCCFRILVKSFYSFTCPTQSQQEGRAGCHFPHPTTQMAPVHSHFTPREKEPCPPPSLHLPILYKLDRKYSSKIVQQKQFHFFCLVFPPLNLNSGLLEHSACVFCV